MANEILDRDENNEPVIGLVTDDANQEIRMGRIDNATKGLKVMIVGGAGAGTVTSVTASTGLTATPNPIIGVGTISLDSKLSPLDSLAGNALKVPRVNAGETALEYFAPSGTGTGTVTSVSVVTANGVSGSVATSTTTPAITLTLGAITPTTVNGLTITTTTGTITITSGKTLSVSDTTTLATSSITLANGKVLTLSDSTTLATSAITLGNGKILTVSDSATIATNAITLGGGEVITFTASNAFTLTTTGATNVTFPTSGTLITTAVATLSSLSSIGTITTGTWQASIIVGTYGGTGVNNGAKTFTYLKNMSFTAADDTGVYTLPTGTKTLVSTDVTTLTSLASIGTVSTGVWQATPVAVTYGGTGATSLTAHGVVIGNTTSAVNVTTAGTAGQVLTSNGASSDPTFQNPTSTGTTKIAFVTTPVTLAAGGGNPETTLISVSVAGGTLGTANAIRGQVYMSDMVGKSSDEATLTFRLKYGGTTIGTTQGFKPAIDTTGSVDDGIIEFVIYANAATNAQISNLMFHASRRNGNPTVSGAGLDVAHQFAAGTAAVDSTASQTLALTAQWSIGTDNINSMVMRSAIIEKIA